ncbi:hypothetical protein C2845_PM01G03480 [Panicum miliaceum]|uniref:Uncharacterized protein n=1 Tax=Panicum miliaceum TaxID=4540 RepID=A0A3L6TJ98_PANMI|nr:hypothetical protein C2845_PM01G03480 [Panicum miliaceum]
MEALARRCPQINPIRDRIESLEINGVSKEVEQLESVANGTTGCNHEDDDVDEVSYKSAS